MSQTEIVEKKNIILKVQFYLKIRTISLYRLDEKNIKAFVKFELDNYAGVEHIDLKEWANIAELTDNSDFTGKLRVINECFEKVEAFKYKIYILC
jgi:hypothetical protein